MAFQAGAFAGRCGGVGKTETRKGSKRGAGSGERGAGGGKSAGPDVSTSRIATNQMPTMKNQRARPPASVSPVLIGLGLGLIFQAATLAEEIRIQPDGKMTLQQAVTRAQAGDTIILEDGVYPAGCRAMNSGTETAPIRLQAAHPLQAIIRGPTPPPAGAKPQHGIQVLGSYLVFSGLRFEHCTHDGLKIQNAHVTVTNCVLRENGWGIQGDTFGGSGLVTGGTADYLRVEQCDIGQNREHGIYISEGADHCVVKNNRLHDNGDYSRAVGGNGLQINALGGREYPSEDALVEGNVIYGNRNRALNLMGVVKSRFLNNEIYEQGLKHPINEATNSCHDNVFENNPTHPGRPAAG